MDHRRFRLERKTREDSYPDVLAEGVEFTGGYVAVYWLSTSVLRTHPSIDDISGLDSHPGIELRWLDSTREQQISQFWDGVTDRISGNSEPDFIPTPTATIELTEVNEAAFEIISGIPTPRRAEEDSELRSEAFVPGRRIQHEWVSVDLASGTAIIRQDVAEQMFSSLPKGAYDV